MAPSTRSSRRLRDDINAWRQQRAERRQHPGASNLASGSAPRVVILGAGMSGLCAAIQLRRSGISDITILERSDGVGGTWRDNHYPGSACDVPSHLYSFSFATNPSWSRKFARQDEILRYFERVADQFALLPLCRFGVEVVAATFDQSRSVWVLRCADGIEIEAEVFIAATGQLSRPFIPPIDGLDTFEGTTFHSARWDHDHTLSGTRVGVIGNGASAVQFVPHVAAEAASMTLFQRSANWILPKPDREFSEREIWAFRHLPGVERAYRFSIYARLESRFTLMRDKSPLRRLVNRKILPEYRKLANDRLPEAACVPDYPIGCKRILISDDYYPALLKKTTRTVVDPIDHIVADGIVTSTGEHFPLDTIIFGTGFQTTKFLTPISVTGLDGRDLHDEWAKGASAHLGMAVPGFPNCFILYGPNTNLGHNSIIFMTERQVEHIVRCVRELWRRGGHMEISPEVMTRSDMETQARAQRTVWVASCDSWYKNAEGRLTNNWPDRTTEYWRETVRSGPDDYDFAPGHVTSGQPARTP